MLCRGGSFSGDKNLANLPQAIEVAGEGGGGGGGADFGSFPLGNYGRVKCVAYDEGDPEQIFANFGSTITVSTSAWNNITDGSFRFGSVTNSANTEMVEKIEFGPLVTALPNNFLNNSGPLYSLSTVKFHENTLTIGSSCLHLSLANRYYNGTLEIDFGGVNNVMANFLSENSYLVHLKLTRSSSPVEIKFGNSCFYDLARLEDVWIDEGVLPPTSTSGGLSYIFSNSVSSASSYKNGITLKGPGAKAWKEALPDNPSGLYRKLILDPEWA